MTAMTLEARGDGTDWRAAARLAEGMRTSKVAEEMEQIGGAARRLEWKEKCDDISSFCDAAVFSAVDYWAPEAGLYRDFHCESSVWVDGDRLGGRADLGVRERRAAASVRHGWSGAVLRAVRSDDRGRSFLPELRASAVVSTTDKALSDTQPSAVDRATGKSRSEGKPLPVACAIGVFLREFRAAAISHTARSLEKTFACAEEIPHPLPKNAKDGAPARATLVNRRANKTLSKPGPPGAGRGVRATVYKRWPASGNQRTAVCEIGVRWARVRIDTKKKSRQDAGATRATASAPIRISRATLSGYATACGDGIPHPLLKDAKDGAPAKATLVNRRANETLSKPGPARRRSRDSRDCVQAVAGQRKPENGSLRDWRSVGVRSNGYEEKEPARCRRYASHSVRSNSF
jgi:hypothetical protein